MVDIGLGSKYASVTINPEFPVLPIYLKSLKSFPINLLQDFLQSCLNCLKSFI